jgi:hypothetical protein
VTCDVVTLPVGCPPDGAHATVPAPQLHGVQLRVSAPTVSNETFVAYAPAGQATSPFCRMQTRKPLADGAHTPALHEARVAEGAQTSAWVDHEIAGTVDVPFDAAHTPLTGTPQAHDEQVAAGAARPLPPPAESPVPVGHAGAAAPPL